jgi:hypothetical protein
LKADNIFPVLRQLETLIGQLGKRAEVQVLDHIHYRGQSFPIYCITLGCKNPDVPVLGLFGGVHGLEKIGSEVILAYLQTLTQLLDWDGELNTRLEKSRLVFVPIVNPVGVYRNTRSNGNNVDLMRNAPIEGIGNTKLYSGQRISPILPWYRGDTLAMEAEAQALCAVVRQQLFSAPLSIALDLHSGFGVRDRLWFPYAHSKKPFASIAETFALKKLFDRCYPQHIYKIEPMSLEYGINGDLWDFLYDEFKLRHDNRRLFIPLTLEMGSWLWLRKNPLHLFHRHGLFHPLLPHRQQRVLRRHFTLLDFLHRSLLFPKAWTGLGAELRDSYYQQAMGLWYD